MNSKIKDCIIEGLPFVALFASSFLCYYVIPEFNLLSAANPRQIAPSDMALPGEIPAYCMEFLKSLNLQTVSVVNAALITITAYLITKSIRLLSLKGEKTIPFFVAIILFWISADLNLAVIYIPCILLFFVLSTKKATIRLIPVLIFPAAYFITGGYSIILLAMLISLIVADRHPDRLLLLLHAIMLILTISLSVYLSRGDQRPLFFPLELPQESFKKMLFLVTTGVLVLMPVLARIDLQLTNYISIKYITSSVLTSVIVISIIILIALHETGFLFAK